ncbi:lantibiotic dehydratase [Chryseolinea lacunae]|uniref:Lantibiotic dehydratase n=1 Tax=Chryseolinea lacunae TaxID=2801331 RepID=A0ABS1KNN4_9BACT|nr:lantibiotic dehydratase [Chryseolinea lacunae]MBL0741059.1 lantibiotic dehydratase [Chryseolinea lacunae]
MHIKKSKNGKYKAFDEFYLRAPVYPLNNIFSIPNDIEVLIKELLNDKYFLSSLYLASRDLFNRSLLIKEGSTSSEDTSKIYSAIMRYWLRMSSRSTPFGTFAGIAMGKIGEITKLCIQPPADHLIYSRLDSTILCGISDYLASVPEIFERLKFHTNSSIYPVGDRVKYVEFKTVNSKRIYSIAEVERQPALDAIMSRARNGAEVGDLLTVIDDGNTSLEERRDFVMEVIANNILVHELSPNVTGKPHLEALIEKLSRIPAATAYVGQLQEIQKILNSGRIGLADMDRLEEIVVSIIGGHLKKEHLVHSDLFLSTKGISLEKEWVDQLAIDIEKVLDLKKNSKFSSMSYFKERFFERYEFREVPLAYALDPEIGIGYGDFDNTNTDHPALLDNLIFKNERDEQKVPLSDFDELLNFKLHEAIRCGAFEITFSEEELQKHSNSEFDSTSDCLYIRGTLLREPEENSSMKFILLDYNPSSATTGLGRFCHGNPEFALKVRNYNQVEESFSKDCIFAEVAYLQEPHMVNLTSRPVLREFEIPYLVNSSVSEEFQIPIDDLLLSIINNELVLRSRRLGKRVIPKMTNAHNYRTKGLPIYAFLCDLRFQNINHGSLINWGPNDLLPFLPRTTYKNIIITRARWRLNSKDHANCKRLAENQRVNYIKQVCLEIGMPRFVAISQADNELPIDLANVHCVDILFDKLFKTDFLILLEFPQGSSNCVVNDVDGKGFFNEIVIPLRRTDETPNVSLTLRKYSQIPQRHFVPGSDWLYVKVFCGFKFAETVLLDIVGPIVEELLKEKVIDRWFFIRYNLPDPHLRLRFHGQDLLWNKVIQYLMAKLQPLIESDMIAKVDTDTYVREIERYGSETIVDSEHLFFFDSAAVLKFLFLLREENDESLRVTFALKGIDRLLDDFGLAIESRKELMLSLRNGFLEEVKGDGELIRQLDLNYRSKMKEIQLFMTTHLQNDTVSDEILSILDERSSSLKKVAQGICLKVTGHADRALYDLLSSYLHMFINRLFTSSQRKQELVLYHYMFKYYNSICARNKQIIESSNSNEHKLVQGV